LILSYKYFYPKNNPPSNLLYKHPWIFGIKIDIVDVEALVEEEAYRDDAVMGRKGRRKTSIELKRAALADCAIWRVTDVVI
jgi:hypothetical protein